MDMFYRAELDFLRNVLKKLRLQTHILQANLLPEKTLDFGLRRFLGHEAEYDQSIRTLAPILRENTVYKLTDAYYCNYVFFMLPGSADRNALLIGPYASFRVTQQQILEKAEELNLSPLQCSRLGEYYRNIPVVLDDGPFFVLITALAERMWGEESAFEIVDLNQDVLTPPIASSPDDAEPEDTLMRINLTETRYSYENELMDHVSKGRVHRAERMIARASLSLLDQRTADPLRNLKNYAIICNTLMRKAAEQGGVHPIHLDRVSAAFARRIETISNLNTGQPLMTEMAQAYCQLVRHQSTGQYSSLIQKVMAYIEADLSGDLALSTLASIHSISPSYLSALFRKETGKTITEFVNEKRVDLGAHLLRSTRLQVQTIAQYCGMPDANYFSKLFKKEFGQTPKQFRETYLSKQSD